LARTHGIGCALLWFAVAAGCRRAPAEIVAFHATSLTAVLGDVAERFQHDNTRTHVRLRPLKCSPGNPGLFSGAEVFAGCAGFGGHVPVDVPVCASPTSLLSPLVLLAVLPTELIYRDFKEME